MYKQRERRVSLLKEADKMGGHNIASLIDKPDDSSSVDISVEENIEELEIMERAGHQLL